MKGLTSAMASTRQQDLDCRSDLSQPRVLTAEPKPGMAVIVASLHNSKVQYRRVRFRRCASFDALPRDVQGSINKHGVHEQQVPPFGNRTLTHVRWVVAA